MPLLQQPIAVNATLREPISETRNRLFLVAAIAIERRLHESHANVGYEAQFDWSLARYRLGTLYERAGQPDQARREYEAFLAEWPEAEPTLPAIVDTRARLKQLLGLQRPPES